MTKESENALEAVENPDDLGDFMAELGDINQELADIEMAQSENILQGELIISRLGLAQPLTPEVAEKKDGWDSGILFDTTTREVLSKNKKPQWLIDAGAEDAKDVNHFDFVPIFKLPTEYVKWPSKDERLEGERNPHWKTLDPTESRVIEGSWPPIGSWDGDGSPPVTAHTNILGVGVHPERGVTTSLIICSFSKTSAKTGRKFVSDVTQQKTKGLPYWATVYHLFGELKKDKGNTFFVFNFARGRTLNTYFNERKIALSVYKKCFEEAKALANPEKGKELQELYLNVANIEEHEDKATGDYEEGSEASDDSDIDF